MSEKPEKDTLSLEFSQEISIRRSSKLLEAKRKRIKEELEQFILHIGLLVPLSKGSPVNHEHYTQLLKEAAQRLGDESFAQLFTSILDNLK